MRNLHVDIGINGAFLTRRWEDPDNWMRLTRELGYPYHSFCADVLDPFFSGDRSYQLETAALTRAAAQRYGVTLFDVYTGVATHRFHGLSHQDERCRARMREWILAAFDLCMALGAPRLGGHWDAFSIETMADEERMGAAWSGIVGQFRDLGDEAGRRGLAALYNEQMYIPSEVPWTLAQTERFLLECNQGRLGAPVLITLDTGHQAGMHYGLAGEDLDYRAWIRRFGAATEIIHLQQTSPDGSHHWPFTSKYNRQGHVRVDEALEALRQSQERFDSSPLASVLPPAAQTLLIAEIIPGSTRTEAQLLDELAETARCLRNYVPEGGLTWNL